MKYSRWAFPPSVQWAPRLWAHPATRPSHWTARRATLSRHWCKNTKQKEGREKEKTREEPGSLWRRDYCTELEGSLVRQSQSFAPSTYSTERRLEPRECGSGTGATREGWGWGGGDQAPQAGMEGKFKHPLTGECKAPRWLWGKSREDTSAWTGQRCSASFFGSPKAVADCDI